MAKPAGIYWAGIIGVCALGTSAVIANPLAQTQNEAPPNVTSASSAPKVKLCGPVDPSIEHITLRRVDANNFTIAFSVRNLGSGEWNSRPEQAVVNLYLVSGLSYYNRSLFSKIELPATSPASQNMLRFTTPPIPNFSKYQTNNEINVEIAYTNDILRDGNRCNDDINLRNNRFKLGARMNDFFARNSMIQTFYPSAGER